MINNVLCRYRRHLAFRRRRGDDLRSLYTFRHAGGAFTASILGAIIGITGIFISEIDVYRYNKNLLYSIPKISDTVMAFLTHYHHSFMSLYTIPKVANTVILGSHPYLAASSNTLISRQCQNIYRQRPGYRVRLQLIMYSGICGWSHYLPGAETHVFNLDRMLHRGAYADASLPAVKKPIFI